MKTFELSKFTGVRNDLSPERFGLGDLVEGMNIELDESGKPYRRLGTTVIDAVASHSLWASRDLALCVQAGSIHRILPDMSKYDLGIPVASTRVAYTELVNEVFCSDGVTSNVISRVDTPRPWGIALPPKLVVSTGPGSLREGTYLITMTYVRSSGQESGAAPVVSAQAGQNEGFIFANLPVSDDPKVTSKRIYVSDCNGELPYLIAEINNSDTLCEVLQLPAERTLPVRTLLMGPPPPGQVVGSYKGRTYVAENNYLWYSQPYEFELFHRFKGYLGFSSPVRTFAPVSDGIFLGSDDEIVFLQGDDPTEFTMHPVANYGSVLGTEKEVPGHYFGEEGAKGKVMMWMSKKGLCVGLDGGEFKNLTGDRYLLPQGVSSGASLFKVRGGTPQFVTTLFD